MKTIVLFGFLLAAILGSGCEIIATTDHSQVHVTDGTVSSFQSQHEHISVDFNSSGLTNVP